MILASKHVLGVIASAMVVAPDFVYGEGLRALSYSTPLRHPPNRFAGFFLLVLAIAGVIFLLVGGTLLVFVVRFRARTDDPDSEPPQLYGSRPIELAWTLAPLLTVFVLGMVVIRSIIEMRPSPTTSADLNVRVVGHRWWWEFEYPDYGFTTANELVIPVGSDGQPRRVKLQLESADVIHSFWVPRLAGKTDLIPGKTNFMTVEANAEGTYFGRCAEFCGTQHARMLIRVVAVSPEQFSRWVLTRWPANTDSEVSEGRRRFMTLACSNCHAIRGTNAEGEFGPDLTHLMSRQTLASGIMENNRENLLRWVGAPDLVKPGCSMPNMRLSDADVKQIVDYVMTLE